MTVKATWNGVILAESDRTILVEGNQYFRREDVVAELLEESGTSTHCTWKGDANYYSIIVNGVRNEDAAWYYREPYGAATDIKDYVAFWKGVEVTGVYAETPESDLWVPKTSSTASTWTSLRAWCKRRLPMALSYPFVAFIQVLEQLQLRRDDNNNWRSRLPPSGAICRFCRES
jgi:uncharacterized protein (DUF427 family)